LKAALGIDIGGTNIKAGIVTDSGVLIHQLLIATEAAAGADALIRKLLEVVHSAAAYCQSNHIELVGIGVGTAGQVNRRTGVVAGATANLPGWAGMRLAERLTAETSLGAVVDNDVNMIAYGEAWQGAGSALDDFLCVSLGTGVGGTMMIHGRIYHGRDGYAGEFGHQIIEKGGAACTCGNRGCWEQYASVTALKRMAAASGLDARLQEPIALFDSARSGDRTAIGVIDRYASYVAAGLVNLIHIVNPSAIVIGGAITAQGDFLFDRIRDEVALKVLPVFQQSSPISIVPAALGEFAGVIGAAGSYFARFANEEGEGGR
jgi:glucokinase